MSIDHAPTEPKARACIGCGAIVIEPVDDDCPHCKNELYPSSKDVPPGSYFYAGALYAADGKVLIDVALDEEPSPPTSERKEFIAWDELDSIDKLIDWRIERTERIGDELVELVRNDFASGHELPLLPPEHATALVAFRSLSDELQAARIRRRATRANRT